ncbi:hypothetical protein FA13DRAFT_980156 [Coprinellus micaceus]|uniref:Uncharacterized protein n=1 Tax=Coprinellus micaceus TaxID=71717 RepID=A0A4Y7RVN2_COPMI|nr:hypothetical protein FA13DRAFT_980156 [Coprinellus micaceus]
MIASVPFSSYSPFLAASEPPESRVRRLPFRATPPPDSRRQVPFRAPTQTETRPLQTPTFIS